MGVFHQISQQWQIQGRAPPPLLLTSFPGFSLTRPMEPYSLSCSVGQVGENPGNEVALLLDQTVRTGPSLIGRSGSANAQSPG